MKILGITYYNFEDSSTNKCLKGVNVHQVKEVKEEMGVGYQSDKVKFSIDKFNELFKVNLPTDDKAKLSAADIETIKKYLEVDALILCDTKGSPQRVEFHK